jgi:hypothetical protein
METVHSRSRVADEGADKLRLQQSREDFKFSIPRRLKCSVCGYVVCQRYCSSEQVSLGGSGFWNDEKVRRVFDIDENHVLTRTVAGPVAIRSLTT